MCVIWGVASSKLLKTWMAFGLTSFQGYISSEAKVSNILLQQLDYKMHHKHGRQNV